MHHQYVACYQKRCISPWRHVATPSWRHITHFGHMSPGCHMSHVTLYWKRLKSQLRRRQTSIQVRTRSVKVRSRSGQGQVRSGKFKNWFLIAVKDFLTAVKDFWPFWPRSKVWPWSKIFDCSDHDQRFGRGQRLMNTRANHIPKREEQVLTIFNQRWLHTRLIVW